MLFQHIFHCCCFLFPSQQSEAQRWPSRGPRSLKRRPGEFCGSSLNPWTPWIPALPSPRCRLPTCNQPREPINYVCGPDRLRPSYIHPARPTAWTSPSRTKRKERSSPAAAPSAQRKANSGFRAPRARLRDTATLRREIQTCRPSRWWCTAATSSWYEGREVPHPSTEKSSSLPASSLLLHYSP